MKYVWRTLVIAIAVVIAVGFLAPYWRADSLRPPIQAALESAMRDRTTIVIAHRLSTIEHASRIVVLQRGRIAETGNHAELLAKSGVYAKLYRIQYALEHEDA